jgi:hypothetical protein
MSPAQREEGVGGDVGLDDAQADLAVEAPDRDVALRVTGVVLFGDVEMLRILKGRIAGGQAEDLAQRADVVQQIIGVGRGPLAHEIARAVVKPPGVTVINPGRLPARML